MKISNLILSVITYYFNIFLVFSQDISKNNLYLIKSFLSNKKINTAILYTPCWTHSSKIQAMYVLNENYVSVLFRNADDLRNNNITENILSISMSHTVLGVVLDWSCFDDTLYDLSDSNLWNSSYHWLMINQQRSVNEIERFVEIKNLSLNLNSEVFYAHLETDKWQLYDIYRTAPSPKGRFIVDIVNETMYGRWGMRSWKYDKRTDLHNLTLNVINVANPYGRAGRNTSERRLSGRELIKYLKSFEVYNVDTMSKFSYAVFEPLMDIFNFSVRLRSTNSWGYKMNGSWDGMIKALIQGRADISGTAAYKNDRLDVVDYSSVTLWRHKPCFTFLHPTGSQDNITLLRPFSFSVWCSLVGLLVLSVLTFYLIVKYEQLSSPLKTNSILANVLLINIAAYCQQSFYVQPTQLAGRIIFVLVFLFGTLLYQFYSSSIVASLLHEPVKNIDSLEKLAKSRLKIGIEDSVNVRLLAKEISMINPSMENILGDKNGSRRLKAEYVLNAEGVAKVKTGGYAFFTDTATSYWFMSKLFSEKEKCELTEISLTQPSRGSIMLQKKSPYKKLFSFGYVKLLETGFVNRELRRWHANKPACMYNKLKSADAFTSVKFGDILPALVVLVIGFVVSLLILIIEYLVFWYQA